MAQRGRKKDKIKLQRLQDNFKLILECKKHGFTMAAILKYFRFRKLYFYSKLTDEQREAVHQITGETSSMKKLNKGVKPFVENLRTKLKTDEF